MSERKVLDQAEKLSNRLLVKECVDQVSDRTSDLSRIFYRELFHQDIRLKSIFTGNVVTLNRKFSNMLSTFANVRYLESITPSIEKMGDRHFRKYGALLEHFDLFEESLIIALQSHLKDKFNPELEAAWRSVFAEVTNLMKAMVTQKESASKAGEDVLTVPEDFLQQIGGIDRIMQVHTRFYETIFLDPWLGQFFHGKHESVLARKQTEFMVAAFGGPNGYTGDTPAFVHMHMYITGEQSDYREQLLRTAIIEEGLSEEVADIWLSVDHSFREGIVKQDVSECVMKCRGQIPIKAVKPS